MKCCRPIINLLLILSLILPLIACSGARPKPLPPAPRPPLIIRPDPIEPLDPIDIPTLDLDNIPTFDFSDLDLATPDFSIPDLNDYCQPSIAEKGALICDKDTPSWILNNFASCDQPFGPFSYRCYY